MEKSNHKNYIEWFDRDWSILVKTQIIPNEKEIFELLSQKFHTDALKDNDKWREILRNLWEICSESCKNIHIALQWIDHINPSLRELVKNICDLDYESLLEVFQRIRLEYFNTKRDENIVEDLDNICSSLDKMRQISKKHTNVISKSE